MGAVSGAQALERGLGVGAHRLSAQMKPARGLFGRVTVGKKLQGLPLALGDRRPGGAGCAAGSMKLPESAAASTAVRIASGEEVLATYAEAPAAIASVAACRSGRRASATIPVRGIARRSALIIAAPGELAAGRAGVELDHRDVEAAGRRVGLDRLAPVGRLLDLEVGLQKAADTDARDGMAIHN